MIALFVAWRQRSLLSSSKCRKHCLVVLIESMQWQVRCGAALIVEPVISVCSGWFLKYSLLIVIVFVANIRAVRAAVMQGDGPNWLLRLSSRLQCDRDKANRTNLATLESLSWNKIGKGRPEGFEKRKGLLERLRGRSVRWRYNGGAL